MFTEYHAAQLSCVTCIHYLPTAKYSPGMPGGMCLFYHTHKATQGHGGLVHFFDALESIPQHVTSEWGRAWLEERTTIRICGCYEFARVH